LNMILPKFHSIFVVELPIVCFRNPGKKALKYCMLYSIELYYDDAGKVSVTPRFSSTDHLLPLRTASISGRRFSTRSLALLRKW
jgi:hypothetical protein